MTSVLEQNFYDTFGIEPKNKCGKDLIYPNCLNPDKCGFDNCIYYQIEYPDITAEKLLAMICIYNNNVYENEKITPSNINTLKEDVLHWIINDFAGNEKFKYQIQELFKGVSE